MILSRSLRGLSVVRGGLVVFALIMAVLLFLHQEMVLESRFTSLTFMATKCKNNSSPLRYITYEPRGGFGNLMFEYASTYGLARRFNLTLLLQDADLQRVFGSSLRAMRSDQLYKELRMELKSRHTGGIASVIDRVHWIHVYESFGSAFDTKLVQDIAMLVDSAAARFGCSTRVGIRVYGYLQSFRYFEPYLSDIRAQFVFSPSQLNVAQMFVQAVRDQNSTALALLAKSHFIWESLSHSHSHSSSPRNGSVPRKTLVASQTEGKVVVVGVHVRRGDMVHDMQLVSAGYQTGNYHYLLNATRFFRNAWAARGATVRFLVSSNDVAWTRTFFPFRHDAIFVGSDTSGGTYFSDNVPSTIKDFLILAHCDAMILTVGSFGFWAATLGNSPKQVIYYAHPFRVGSLIEREHNYSVRDYYPPSWIAMAD